VSSRVDTWAPLGKYDWTCASFGPPESTTQMTNWSVQPFLHSSQQKVPMQWATLSPQIAPYHGGSGSPPKSWFIGPVRAHNQNGITFSSAVFAQVTAECPVFYNGTPLPCQNYPFPWWIWAPNLITDSLDPAKSSPKWHLDRFSPFCRAH